MKRGKAPYLAPDALDGALQAQTTHIHCNRDRAIVLVSHYLGLRAMELAALKVSDVWDSRAMAVREVWRLHVTKGDRFREVFLVNDKAKAAMVTYLRERGTRNADGPLFMSQRGGAFSANTMQRLIAICYRRAGIQASSHSGRRTFATNLIQRGVDIYSIKELMGHSSIMTTQEYFTSSPARLKAMAGMLS